MKKRTVLLSFLAFLVIILSACSRSNNLPAGNQVASSQKSGNEDFRSNRLNRPDFGQPDKPADVRGVVKSVVGNEATIIVMDPEKSGRATSTEADLAGEREEAGKVAVGLASGPIPGGGPMMGGGPMGGQRDSSSVNREELMAKIKEMSSGEEKVLIPVGIKMLKASTANGQREMVEATLQDISADKMISIWLDSKVTDKKVAEFVLIN